MGLAMSGERVKVAFTDSEGDTEWLWGEALAEGQVRLQNSPFLAYGVSCNDVVRVKRLDGAWVFEAVAEKSGHRTLRLMLTEAHDPTRLLAKAVRMGARLEGAFGRIVALDVPPDRDFWAIARHVATLGVDWELVDPTHEELYGEPAPER